MQWNFEKFLINSQGHIVGHWGARDEPESFRSAVEALL